MKCLHTLTRNLAVYIVAATTLLTAMGAAANDNSLDTWLRHHAGPALSRIVNAEPRFLGEPVSIVAMQQGQVTAVNDRLTLRMRDELRRLLLASTRAQVPLDAGSGQCASTRTRLALGIEITRFDRTNHRVELAFLDLDEGVWINGSMQTWTGRLDPHAADLFAAGIGPATPVVSASDIDQIATQIDNLLQQKIRCGFHFAEPVFVEGSENRLTSAITMKLGDSYEMVDQSALAATRLEVIKSEGMVSLRFADARTDLVSVSLAAPVSAKPLLGDIKISSTRQDCRGHGKRCVDIEYEVLDDAFVFEFFSHKGSLFSLNCEQEPRRQFGLVNQALKVPRVRRTDPNRPVLGYYVMAVRDPATAASLRRILRSADSCKATPDATDLAQLSELVTSQHVAWRTIHFRDRRGRIEVI